MTAFLPIFTANIAMVMTLMLLLWLASIALGDVSFIDSFWGFGFVLIAALTFTLTPDGSEQRKLLILALAGFWGVRLGLHLLLRWRREGPDKRYVALLRHATARHRTSLTKVFLLQGGLMLLVALPIMLGMMPAEPDAVGWLGWTGAALAVTGILFETIGDWQLARHRASGVGGVMDQGLWRYTRHPNYFGDCCLWWGLFLIAAETGPGRFAIIGPVIMTALLLKWSGAALLERRMKRSRPDYEDYIRRTSAFIPLPPRQG